MKELSRFVDVKDVTKTLEKVRNELAKECIEISICLKCGELAVHLAKPTDEIVHHECVRWRRDG
nr:hypothetical protein [Candidatus Njordarchaeota archaeon]